jgi:triosephosphate isomerase
MRSSRGYEMYRELDLTPPFFIVGPKAYMFGPDILQLAMRADELSRRYDVQIIIDPQYVDIPIIAQHVRRALVFAQHMDSLKQGPGQGSVLPEALRAAGAVGVVLNHFERRLTQEELACTMRRADEVGLATIVCADDTEAAVAVAELEPNGIVLESPDLIGTGRGTESTRATVGDSNRAIWRVNREIRVVYGGGIGCPKDVYDVIAAGAQGTGSSSAIPQASDPQAMLEAMVKATREAWEAAH